MICTFDQQKMLTSSITIKVIDFFSIFRELKKLSAHQFMEVWEHYDEDGKWIAYVQLHMVCEGFFLGTFRTNSWELNFLRTKFFETYFLELTGRLLKYCWFLVF